LTYKAIKSRYYGRGGLPMAKKIHFFIIGMVLVTLLSVAGCTQTDESNVSLTEFTNSQFGFSIGYPDDGNFKIHEAYYPTIYEHIININPIKNSRECPKISVDIQDRDLSFERYKDLITSREYLDSKGNRIKPDIWYSKFKGYDALNIVWEFEGKTNKFIAIKENNRIYGVEVWYSKLELDTDKYNIDEIFDSVKIIKQ